MEVRRRAGGDGASVGGGEGPSSSAGALWASMEESQAYM